MPEEYHNLHLFNAQTTPTGPVTCLGQTFANDAERRAHFTELLRQKLRDPEFRAIEGFPIGTDEAILALSDPPYYTACPNPWIGDLIAEWQAEKEALKAQGLRSDKPYHREPFAADVSEGKNDPIYNAHSYHTKVPHKAIMRYILHYTEPGDIVLDGFCGTGMTGVAAMQCGDKQAVASLSKAPVTKEASQVGQRYAVLNDISPIATFVARNLLSPRATESFIREADRILNAVQEELSWVYKTKHPSGSSKRQFGEILYAVWSDGFICPECGNVMLASDVVIDRIGKLMRQEFPCPACGTLLKRRQLQRVMETTLDPVLGIPYKHTKTKQVMIQYQVGNNKFTKIPDDHDYEIQSKCMALLKPLSIPIQSFEHTLQHLRDGNHIRGITHSHHFYTPRNLLVLSTLMHHIRTSSLSHEMLFVFTGLLDGHANRRNRYIVDRHHPKGTTCGPLSNTLFVPELQSEVNIFNAWKKTVSKQKKSMRIDLPRKAYCEVRSATQLSLPADCIDYIFVDPPFGKNINYSDLNLLWESWLGVRSSATSEAIVNKAQKKDLREYGDLMRIAFQEFHRVLKPGRWMTLEFHNSLNSVWAAIQEALEAAGFVIADVRVLDKKQGTLHQDSGYTVKQDLVVSSYKPSQQFEERFSLMAGTADSAWEFVRSHLAQVPVAFDRDGKLEPIRERMADLLYDRMVAYHVLHGVAVPLSAAEFRQGLVAKFPSRDDMYFLPQQVVEYDKKRLAAQELGQLQIFVSDESSAIAWLRQQLGRKPQTRQELQPQFMQETKGGWQRFEQTLELRDLLEQNYLHYDGRGEVPAQIHSYLSTNYKDLRNLPKDDDALRAAANERWYVPDPNKAADLEKLRERHLLREFETYRDSKQRKLKVFRLEAMRAGFKKAWQERDYETILTIAKKIPDDVLHEDPKLLMYVDMAQTRAGG